jgi:NADH dehydrogenase [ubiquinone] 1 alpha subcomplex assembly factor 5
MRKGGLQTALYRWPQRRAVQRVGSASLFSSEATSTSKAFDRPFKRVQRDNAARLAKKYDPSKYDYLQEEISVRLVDRLDDIRREEGFPLALDIGAGAGHVYRAICAEDAIMGEGGIGGVRKLVQLESADEFLHRDANQSIPGQERCDTYRLCADEEKRLPFPDGTFDLVISSGSLHWVNNLPGLFAEVNRVLKPDGCFMFAMIGGTTLPELRVALVLAEQEREGGVSPHVGPFAELSDLGGLLQRHGFALPTLDTDSIRLAFPNAAVLMEHLQRMGEGNASLKRRPRIALDTFLAATCLYDHMYPEGSDESAVEASVQVIYAIGWTPHESQQKPLVRGSAQHRIKDAAGKGE